MKDSAREVLGAAELYRGDCLEVLQDIVRRNPGGAFDLIFADPPYFLSNGGITCKSGRMAKVDKGAWDKSRGVDENHEFNRRWLALCQKALKPDGTIWISGTAHVIHSVGFALQQLGFKILNDIAWVKRNPPPNLSCRYFTHASETILWAAKNVKSRHVFNYADMKRDNGGKQMKSVWDILPPAVSEKKWGKHPTQKPLELLRRIIRASSKPGDVVLDPFMGSGTTGLAALELGRRFTGIELDKKYFVLAKTRISPALATQIPAFSRHAWSQDAAPQRNLVEA